MNVHELAKQIADELGDEWTARGGHQNSGEDAFLSGPDGVELHVREPSWPSSMKGRLRISGSFPQELRNHDRGADKHSITVALSKPPRRIAADIRRRLLPDHEAALKRVRERFERAENKRRWQEETGARLWGELIGVRAVPAPGGAVLFDSGEAKPNDDGETVEFRITVDGERAVKLARFIAGMEASG